LKTFDEILKEMDSLEKKSTKISEKKFALITELQKVCPHEDIVDYYDTEWLRSTHVRYCKLCKSENV